VWVARYVAWASHSSRPFSPIHDRPRRARRRSSYDANARTYIVIFVCRFHAGSGLYYVTTPTLAGIRQGPSPVAIAARRISCQINPREQDDESTALLQSWIPRPGNYDPSSKIRTQRRLYFEFHRRGSRLFYTLTTGLGCRRQDNLDSRPVSAVKLCSRLRIDVRLLPFVPAKGESHPRCGSVSRQRLLVPIEPRLSTPKVCASGCAGLRRPGYQQPCGKAAGPPLRSILFHPVGVLQAGSGN
jgi:hypothetical protein